MSAVKDIQADIVFIDGDHTYTGFRHDLLNYRLISNMEGIMFDARRRQLGWLFFLLLVGISHGQGPATTVVSDVVFWADGTRAAGTLALVHHGERGSGGSGNQERNGRSAG